MNEKESKNKIITIDLDNKEIHTSNTKIKNLLISSKEITGNAFSSLDLNSFEIVDTLKKNKGKTTGDKLSLASIKKYVKENNPDLLEELNSVINTQAVDKKTNKPLFTKNNKPKKVSFLIVKNWFYSKFPDMNPKNKK